MSSDRRKIQCAVTQPESDDGIAQRTVAIGLRRQEMLGVGVRLRTDLPTHHMNAPARPMAEGDETALRLSDALRHSHSCGSSRPELFLHQ